MLDKLDIPTLDSIYQGETFSRKSTLTIDGVDQDLSSYTVTYYIYKESKACKSKLYSGTLSNGTILIPADITKTLNGNYILIVVFDLAGFITIRKARFKVEEI